MYKDGLVHVVANRPGNLTVTHRDVTAFPDEIAVGIESGSTEVLKRTGKGVSLNDVRRAAAVCQRIGIKLYAMFVLGLPGETEATIKKSVALAKQIKPFYTQFCFATPFPNTRIYQYILWRSNCRMGGPCRSRN